MEQNAGQEKVQIDGEEYELVAQKDVPKGKGKKYFYLQNNNIPYLTIKYPSGSFGPLTRLSK